MIIIIEKLAFSASKITVDDVISEEEKNMP